MTTQSTTGDASRYTHRRQMAGVGLVSFFSAGVSYVVLVLVAHALSPQENAVFLTYWALLFGTFGVLTGLFSESARAGFGSENPARAGRPRLVGSALGFGLGLCLLLGAIGALVSTLLLDRQHAWMIGIVAVAGVGFSGHLAVSGVLAGQQRWDGMALVTLWEAMTRLVSVLIVFLLVPSLTALALVSAVPALAWLVLLLRRKVRQTLHARSDTDVRQQLANFGHASVASACTAALVVGFPILIRLTTDRAAYLGAAGLLLAISLTRAPLMVPLNAYQGVAIAHFMSRRHEGLRGLYPVLGVTVVATGVAAGLAATIGPWVFGMLLGEQYQITGRLLAGLTAGAGALAALTLTGACCLAIGAHRGYAVGWMCSTAVAILVLLLPIELNVRVVLALVLGPLIGILVHSWSIKRTFVASGPARDA